MLRLDLDLDLNAAIAFLSQASRRHVPFAASLALNRIATEARDAVRVDMPHRFTTRRPWVIKGIGTERATKGNLNAAVFSRDAFMADQEEGGKRTGRQIIPVGRMADVHASRVIPKSLQPKALYASRKAVYHGGTLFERRGGELRPLYLLRKRVKVTPRFGMTERVRSVVLAGFAGAFEKALHEALAGAK